MRITQGLMNDHFLRNLQTNLTRLDKFYRQLSSGKRISVPSDDPSGVAKAMRLRSSLFSVQQYTQNVADAKAWMSDTDAALSSVTSTMQAIRELAVQGATDTLDDTARQAVADEVDQLFGQLITLANSTHGTRYLFAGEQTKTAPYEADTDDDGDIIVSDAGYSGDAATMEVEISPDVTLEYNIPGHQVFDDLFEAVQTLRDDLRNNDIEAVGGDDLAAIQDSIDEMLRLRSENGAKVNRLEATELRLGDMEINVEEHLSSVEDVDVAKMLTDLKMQESVYNAALATGARILQPTLVDFMR